MDLILALWLFLAGCAPMHEAPEPDSWMFLPSDPDGLLLYESTDTIDDGGGK